MGCNEYDCGVMIMRIDPVNDGIYGAEKSYRLVLEDNEAVALMGGSAKNVESIIMSNGILELKHFSGIHTIIIKDNKIIVDGISDIIDGALKLIHLLKK